MEQKFATMFDDVRHERSLILEIITNRSRYFKTIQIHRR